MIKLRHPYEHALTEEQWKELYAALRRVCKSAKLQCDLVDRKPITYGYKINVFLLGYRPGLCGDGGTSEGITQLEWDALTSTLRHVIKSAVPSAVIHPEAWSSVKKFSFRWETYIQTREP